jgi:hypothetical protein
MPFVERVLLFVDPGKMPGGKRLLAALLMVAVPALRAKASAQAPKDLALGLVGDHFLWESRYQYIMGGKVRLLLFWVGKDDVGGGYILLGRGSKDPSLEAVKLVFGSSPEKSPRQINLWGVATEVVQQAPGDGPYRASAFLGFRKRHEDEIPEGAYAFRPSEKTGPEGARGFFGASLNYVDSEGAFARRTRFSTERDFELGELEEVERMVISRIAEVEGDDRRLTGDERSVCARVPGFLVTLEELIEEIVEKGTSLQRCYFYDARPYTISVTSRSPVARHRVRIEREGGGRIERTYRDLVQARFQILNHETGEKTSFTLLVGTSGPWRGVPVRVVYQPSWWIQIFLNLESVAAESITSPPPLGQR